MERFLVMARFPLLNEGEWEQYGKDVQTKAQAVNLVRFILDQLTPYQISITDFKEKQRKSPSLPEKKAAIQKSLDGWKP